MKIKISNKQIEKKCLLYLFIMGLFCNYIGYTFIWNLIFIVLFVLLGLLSNDFKKSMKTNNSSIIWLIIIFIYFIFNILVTETYEYALSNLSNLIKVYLIYIMIVGIANEEDSIIMRFMEDRFFLINFIWIINLIILCLQYSGIGILIKDEWLEKNSFYYDHCTGIFGPNASHVMTFFSVFVIIYNSIFSKNKKYTFIINAYNLISTIILIIIANKIDNNSLIIMLIYFYILYFFENIINGNFNTSIKLKKIFLYVISCIALSFIMYNIPLINNAINEKIFPRIYKVLVVNSEYSVIGSNERLAIFYSSLENYSGWKLGVGLGSWKLDNQNFLGFAHFGISSLGSFTALGGIWFLMLNIVFFVSGFLNQYYKKNVLNKMVMVITFIVLTLYTQIFTNALAVIWISFLITMINESCKTKKIKGENNENRNNNIIWKQ